MCAVAVTGQAQGSAEGSEGLPVAVGVVRQGVGQTGEASDDTDDSNDDETATAAATKQSKKSEYWKYKGGK